MERFSRLLPGIELDIPIFREIEIDITSAITETEHPVYVITDWGSILED
jgi:hypothetical protein